MAGTTPSYDKLAHAGGVAGVPGEGTGPDAASTVGRSTRTEPVIGVIRNPRSHLNSSREAAEEPVPGAIIRMPMKHGDLDEILDDFAACKIDYLAIDGGDGTIRDVLTRGARVFGARWPEIIILPSGKTNALAYDLGLPADWQLTEAAKALGKGQRKSRSPLSIASRDGSGDEMRGFVLGGGVFTRAIALGQDAHRFGAFNAWVVGITAIWTLLQALFGGRGNAWRQGTRIRLADAKDDDVPHFGGGASDERYLVFASTLVDLPAGLRPFHGVTDTLRVAVLDNASRRLLFRIPALFRGHRSDRTRELGANAFGIDVLHFDTAADFILDGEAFPPGQYRIAPGPELTFVVP